jgi:MarR family transcriptional regulator, transcriptional regulator for hemolysin
MTCAVVPSDFIRGCSGVMRDSVASPGRFRRTNRSMLIIARYRIEQTMEASSPTLVFVLHGVARLLKKRFEQHARGSGLTRSQWQVLAYLARNKGISQSGLAALLEVEPITLTRIADKLEAMGLIARQPHPTDRRVRLLYLTSAAYPKLTQVRRLGDITCGEALAGIFEADRARLLEMLQAMRENLIQACEAPVTKQKRGARG